MPFNSFIGDLQKKIKEKIGVIATIANDFPGVIIIHSMRDWSVVWMTPKGLQQLGLTEEQMNSLSAEEYYSRFFNSEDAKDYVPKVFGLIERNNDEESVTYFQQVKFFNDEDWHWHMSSTKIFMKDLDGKPLLVITISFPIDPKHHLTAKAGRLLEENNFLRKNEKYFAQLSKREREILRFLALGKTSPETAKILSIATTTVETHRRNIKKKLNTNSFYDLSLYARALDLI